MCSSFVHNFLRIVSLLQTLVECDFLACYLYYGPITDMGWTYQHNLARAAVDRQFGTRSKYVEGFGFMDDAGQRQTLDRYIQDGCKIIFTGSGAFTFLTIEYANAHPEVKFFNLGGVAPPDLVNMGGSIIKVHQGCYINGVIGAMTNGIDHLGYVGSTYMADSLLCVNAFFLGARSVNANIKLSLMHTGSWFAPREERIASLRLINRGAQILNYDSDSTTPVQVAKASGILSFGMKVDATSIYGESNLASQVFVWTSIFTAAIQAVMDGSNSSLWLNGRNANKFVGFDKQALSLGSYSVDVNAGQQDAAYNLIKIFSAGDDFVFCREGGFSTFCSSGATKPSMSFGGTPPVFIFPCDQSFANKNCMTDDDMLATTWLIEGIDDLGLLIVPKSCSPGFYEDPLAEELCIPCSVGRFTDEMDQLSCEPCSPGSFTAETNSTKCDLCPAGTFAEGDGNANCSSCPFGRFSPRGSGICSLCKPGFYCNEEGAKDCTICAPGKYAPMEGSSECMRCGDVLAGSTTQLMGADNSSFCVCPSGFFNKQDYSKDAEPACQKCPEGVHCPGYSALGNPQETLELGYFAVPLDPLEGVWKCTSEDACVGQLEFGSNPCAANKQGLNCGMCAEGYYASGRRGSSCNECMEGANLALPLALCALLAAAGALSYAMNKKAAYADAVQSVLGPIAMGLTLMFMQALVIFSKLSFHWPFEFDATIGGLGIFLFDLKMLAPGCHVSETLLSSYLSRLAIPFIIVAAFFLWYILSRVLCQITKGWFQAFNVYVILNTLGMVVQALYISFVDASVVVLECYESPNGKYAVMRNPYVECFTSDYYVAVPFAVIALLFYVIGIYAVLAYVTWIAPARVSNLKFITSTRFMFYKYHYSRWWFGLVLMGRSALLALVAVVEPNDGHRQFIMLLFIIVASLAMQLIHSPFSERLANRLEILELVLLIVILGLGSWFIEDRDFLGEERRTTMVLSGLLCSCIGIFACVLLISLLFAVDLACNPVKVADIRLQEARNVMKKLRPAAALVATMDDAKLQSMLTRITYIDRWYFLEMSDIALLELAGLACDRNKRMSSRRQGSQNDTNLKEICRQASLDAGNMNGSSIDVLRVNGANSTLDDHNGKHLNGVSSNRAEKEDCSHQGKCEKMSVVVREMKLLWL